MQDNLKTISGYFAVKGDFVSGYTNEVGHINDTLVGDFNNGGKTDTYVFQRINTNVFKDPRGLMENVSRVIDNISKKIDASGGKETFLSLVPTADGKPYKVTDDGSFWRCYKFIPDSTSFDVMEKPEHAYEAAFAFGMFQRQLSDMKGARLNEIIPDFHNTPKRLETFDRSLAADRCSRAAGLEKEIAFINYFRKKASVVTDLLASGALPERITHNDTKLNNVLFNKNTGHAICVIDLDTVMPGSSLYDFGDLIRTSVSPAPEDETDLSKIVCRMDIYSALAEGFLKGAGGALTEKEIELMPFSGQLITFETGIRFLTDHLDGDVYFKVHRPGHNLERARSQFKLVCELIEHEREMRDITHSFASSVSGK